MFQGTYFYGVISDRVTALYQEKQQDSITKATGKKICCVSLKM